jgi:hypothetical protein
VARRLGRPNRNPGSFDRLPDIWGAEMEVFREMKIWGDSEQVAALMDKVEKALPDDWQRHRTSEGSTQAYMVGAKSLYCFVHNQDDELPSATVYMAETTTNPGVLAAANIHPHKKRQLTHEEYNSILLVFYEMVQTCAQEMGLRVDLTSSQADLSEWLSDKAAMKLRAFSTSANKSAGFLLTNEYERWFDFIVTAHGERSRLDSSTLRRWLVEIEGWSPEIADQLAGEYAFGGELLTFTDSRRGGN